MNRFRKYGVVLTIVCSLLVAGFAGSSATFLTARAAPSAVVLLSPSQMSTLKTDIQADQVLNAFPNTPDGAFEIAAAYNVTAAPDYWVWRTNVTKSEIVQSTSSDSTTFNWVGTGFITRSAGEQAAWRELFDSTGSCNPSLPNVRQAFADIFSGSGNAAANRTHLLTIGRRKSTRAEKLFASGSGTTGSPSTMTFEGSLGYQDVQTARNLP